MPIDFSNPGYVSKNGQQSLHNSEHAVYSGVKHSSFLNPKASPQRMEAKLFLTVLSYIGLGSYVAGVVLNIGTWKADILAVFGFAFILLKFIRLTLKTWQSYRREEIEIKVLKKKSEED
jgi:hypothetical protein